MAKIVVFGTLKGGSGKTSLAILFKRYAEAVGKKVLFVDADVQNSSTFYFDDDEDAFEGKTFASALMEGTVENNIAHSLRGDIVPSSVELAKLRAIGLPVVKKVLESATGYDYVIVDTAPNLDNLVLGAVAAADITVALVDCSSFGIKTTTFWIEELQNNILGWPGDSQVVSVGNIWNEPNGGRYTDYAMDSVPNFSAIQIPNSRLVKAAIDTGETLSGSIRKMRLYGPLCALFSGLLETDGCPERF